MKKFKLIRSLSLLLVLIVGILPIIASAQNPPMSVTINAVIPTSDPYCTPVVVNGDNTYPNLPSRIDRSSFSSNPELCTLVALTGDSVPAGVVDWVLVELRVAERSGTDANSNDANNSAIASVIARKPGFLLNNGRIVDALAYEALAAESQTPSACNEDSSVVANLEANDSCPDLVFDEGDIVNSLDRDGDGTDDDLYLVVRHRNHLDIMSTTPLSDTSGSYIYDFTDDTSSTRSGNNGIKANAGPQNRNRVAMFAGDATGNNDIDIDDFNNGVVPDFGRRNQYFKGDTTLNAEVDLDDFNNAIGTNFGERSRFTEF